MRILFISSLSLATNPRFYKEIMLAKENGYEIEVICLEFNNWSYGFNRELIQTLGDSPVHLIGGNRKPFGQWVAGVSKERFYRYIGKYFKINRRVLSQAVTRRSGLLLKHIRKLNGTYDLVIGHNPGALYPAFFASKIFNCKCGFDVEDYHPEEGENKRVQRLTKKLMNQYLPLMDYLTFSSPLIRAAYQDDIGSEGDNRDVILNLFPRRQFEFCQRNYDEPLQIVWFSQLVNFKRGLEQWIAALEYFKDEIVLTLIGAKKEPFYAEFVKEKSFIKFLEPMGPEALNRQICTYDVGLAIDRPKDYNSAIALSNKLITYYQAGLYALATDTPAQKEFLKSHPHSGMTISTDQEGFIDKLAQIIASKDSIRRTKSERFKNARQFNWETESGKLLKLWTRCMAAKEV